MTAPTEKPASVFFTVSSPHQGIRSRTLRHSRQEKIVHPENPSARVFPGAYILAPGPVCTPAAADGLVPWGIVTGISEDSGQPNPTTVSTAARLMTSFLFQAA